MKEIFKTLARDPRSWGLEIQVIFFLMVSLAVIFYNLFHFRDSIQEKAQARRVVEEYLELSKAIELVEDEMFRLDVALNNFPDPPTPAYLTDIRYRLQTLQQHTEDVIQLLPDDYPLKENLRSLIEQRIKVTQEKIASFKSTDRPEDVFSRLWSEELSRIRTQLLVPKEAVIREVNLLGQEKDRAHNNSNIISGVITFLLTALILAIVIRDVKRNRESEQQLIDARERAESAAKAKEQFLANMSHEIRTPLNAIIGYSAFLQRTELTERQDEFVDGIRSAGHTLLSLVNDILDLSKLEADMLRFEKLPFHLQGLLQSVEQMFQPQANEKGVRLQLHPLQDLPDVLVGDPTRLTQMLINIIGNAVKFTSEGRIDIWIRSISRSHNHIRLEFKIQDTGIGIPPDKLDTIFERFEQAASETSRKYGGTGLGLSIVKKLAELQGGRVYAQSKPEHGTTFFLEMPYRIAESEEVPQARLLDTPIEQMRATLRDIHVLVVEDNTMNQHIASLMLQRMGLTFEIAQHGQEALDLLGRQSFDLILMDLQMPILDGYRTAHRIRREMGLQIPIIAMTAHALAGEREKCLNAGMNDYISKPIREQELFRLIARHVHPQHGVPDNGSEKIATDLYLDYGYLHEVSGGDPAALAELAGIFLQQAPRELHQLEGHLAARRFSQLAETAHSMKSTVAYMGLAATLGKLLEQLETAARSKDPDADHLQHLLQQVTETTRAAVQLVRQEV